MRTRFFVRGVVDPELHVVRSGVFFVGIVPRINVRKA